MKEVTRTGREPGEESPTETIPISSRTNGVSHAGLAPLAICAEEQIWQ
jgi:hypothetical protein